jgi:hypothetical protein
MNQEAAFAALEEQRKKFLARIPANAPLLRTRYLGNVVEDEIKAARIHLQALFASGLEVGPGFAAHEAHVSHPKYAFWIEGVRRHLQSCEALLAEQPTGG